MTNLSQSEQCSSKFKAFPGQTGEPMGTHMQMGLKSTLELKFSNNAHVNAHIHSHAQLRVNSTTTTGTKASSQDSWRCENASQSNNEHVTAHIHMWGFRKLPPRTLNHRHKATKGKKMLAHVNFQIHIQAIEDWAHHHHN